MATPRQLRPRAPITATPIAISDLTSFDLLGLEGPAFRRFLSAHAVPHVVSGRRVIARSTAITQKLDELAKTEADRDHVAIDESGPSVASELRRETRRETQPETVNGVLAMLGRRSA